MGSRLLAPPPSARPRLRQGLCKVKRESSNHAPKRHTANLSLSPVAEAPREPRNPSQAGTETMRVLSPGRRRWLHPLRAHPHLLLQLLKPQGGDAPRGGPQGGLGTTPHPLQSVPGHLGVQGEGTVVGSGNLVEKGSKESGEEISWHLSLVLVEEKDRLARFTL